MAHDSEDDGAWFAPKRFGLGSGLPIRWQGWAVYLAALAAIGGAGLLPADRPARWILIGLVILALILVTARRTRGGWKWRWGGE